MKPPRKIVRFVIALLLAIALSAYAHRAHAAQTFSGPGLFISQNTCTDILTPVAGQSWCFDSTNNTIKYWNGTAWVIAFVGSFPLGQNANFNNYSGININQLDLTVLNPPSSVSTTATCSGTCATTYTYEVTCLSDIGAETLPSAQVTATNAASLSSTNFNVINWAPGVACYSGYNVYGRTGGSLVLLATVPAGTTTFTDQGGVTAPTNYKITFTTSLGSSALPAFAVWDLRGAKGWIDAATNNAVSNPGVSLTATGFTTPVNHDLEVPIFGFGSGAGVFTPPGGFASTVNIPAVTGTTSGFWGGTKDIAAAGAVANQTGTTVGASNWAALHFSFTPANIASAVTVVATSTCTVNAAGTVVTCSDPTGTLTGDLEFICGAWGSGATSFPSYPAVPATFNLLGSAGFGVPGQAGGFTDVACFTNSPNVGGSGVLPPTVNKTGILQQTTATGAFEETVLGIQTMDASSGNVPNGAAALLVKQFPMPLTTIACLVNWTPFAGCSPFPVFAIKDVTSGNVLCSTGTVTTSAGGGAVAPSSTTQFAANDQLNFMATTIGGSCTSGFASISAIFKE